MVSINVLIPTTAMITRDRLLDLRLRYRFSEPFSAERDRLWGQIQEAEQGLHPDLIRSVIEEVVFAPEPDDEQLDLPLVA